MILNQAHLCDSEDYQVLGQSNLCLSTYLSLPWKATLVRAEVSLCTWSTVGRVRFIDHVPELPVGATEILKRRGHTLLLKNRKTGKVFLSRICGGKF